MVSKPGGATVKPDDFYRLYALHMQVRVRVCACTCADARQGACRFG